VIGKRGKLTGRIAIHDPVGAAVQRELLEHEGVRVGDTGVVKLDVYGWLPTSSGNSRTRARPARSRRRRS
jgi:methylated-DNA-protein-cysteine methyltransferase-like protein